VKKVPRAGPSLLRSAPFNCVQVHAPKAGARQMIALLERRASPATEGGASSGWSRQAQAPSIQRDGTPYDPHLDRFLADLPLNGVRITDEPRADHAQYLASWLSVLKADKKAIFTAASKASEAAAFLAALQGA
jgi:hypothetical protein